MVATERPSGRTIKIKEPASTTIHTKYLCLGQTRAPNFAVRSAGLGNSAIQAWTWQVHFTMPWPPKKSTSNLTVLLNNLDSEALRQLTK